MKRIILFLVFLSGMTLPTVFAWAKEALETRPGAPYEGFIIAETLAVFWIGIIGLVVWGHNEMALAYARGWGFKLTVGLAIANLLVCIFHYHRTAMRLDVATRVLTYVWILAACIYLVVWKENLPVG